MNDFTIISKLGEGAYSIVYKVKRNIDNNIYALKKVKLLNLSEKEKQNSLNEVRLLASVKSNYVISYKEAFFDEKDSTLGIVMEFADGGDLYQKIVEHKKTATFFEEQDIWKIFIQLVKGLKALHDLKILHRDLKSANVFLLKDGTAKLGDLNVSKVARRGLGYTQTGTPYYASPEVWKDQPYDNKSDIWSLGCVLYEMITLRPPFRAQNMEGLYNKVIKGQLNKIPERFSNELFEIVKLLIQVNSDLRPSCDDILKNKIIQKRIEYFKSFNGEQENDDKALLKTIKMPKNLLFLSDKLPKPNYSKSIQNQNIQNNCNRSYSKQKTDNINEQINNIKILPKVKIQEPKISNQNLKLDINIKKNSPSLIHSGSQKLIINSNNKKSLQRNMSELPSLKSGNQNRINNNLYKIYAPIINRQKINNQYKAYNYLNMLQKYYKIQKPQINNSSNINNINNNNHYYQPKINRIGSGKKNIPNRILSPIKRNNNIINIS
jgi:NIMA (never in mitosis gene a)-related kinase